MKQLFNDFRDFIPDFGVSEEIRQEIIKIIYLKHKNNLNNITKETILTELDNIKKRYLSMFDFISKHVDENYEIYDEKYLATVNYGYNGIVTGRTYFVNIQGNKVEFYADETYEHLIPQSLPFDDIDIIKEPTQEDIDKAKENGRNSYHAYFHHFPEQEEKQ